MINLESATSALAELVNGVRDDQLTAATPCSDITLGDLLDHVNNFATVFAAAGTKVKLASGSQAPKPDASRLGPDWRERIPDLVKALGQAWVPASAWQGTADAGGQELPAELVGVIALDEIIVHSWDIAVSSNQPYSCEPDLVEAAHQFVESTVAQNPNGSPGRFGSPVRVSAGASSLDQLIGMTGRNPSWRP